VETLREERLVENAAAMGEVLAAGLAGLADGHPSVGEVRGLGLLWGLELVRDRETREPLVPYAAAGEAARPMAALRRAAMDRGLHLYAHGNLLLVAPPLVVGRDELDTGLAILDDVLAVADGLTGTGAAAGSGSAGGSGST